MALLAVAELRKHLPDFPTGADNDDVLTRLLDAAEAAITQAAGAVGAVTEFSGGGGHYLVLNRPAGSFTSITEDFDGTALVLSADDYRLSPSGYILTRLTTGTNARSTWHGLVQVIYTPVADTAQREAAQILLIEQFLNYHPGLTSETIGSWTQTFYANSVYNWAIERENILATVRPGGRMAVIG